MKKVVMMGVLGAGLLAALQSASAYETKPYGKESGSTVYQIVCGNGDKILVRNENNGKWCSGSTCYATLEQLMRNAYAKCK